MGGGGAPNAGTPEINQGNQFYGQLATQAQQLFAQYFPILQQLYPELMGTINGQNTPIMKTAQTAAMAPVNAERSSLINSIQGATSGMPGQGSILQNLYEQGIGGAAVAGDTASQNAMSESLGSLGSLVSMSAGQSSADMTNAAGGLSSTGLNLNQQQLQAQQQQLGFWESLFGGIGEAAGAGAFSHGKSLIPPPAANPMAGVQYSGGLPTGVSATPAPPPVDPNIFSMMGGVAPATAGMGSSSSAPISGSTTPPSYSVPGFLGAESFFPSSNG